MIRVSVHLTEAQRVGLSALTESTGKGRSELIREAVDRLIEQSGAKRREVVLDRAAGMWKDRSDLPDFRELRAEWG